MTNYRVKYNKNIYLSAINQYQCPNIYYIIYPNFNTVLIVLEANRQNLLVCC